ncbi:MAG: hypothetical protein M3198_09395, partial [Actinomycetota bacterium]|nr:hypothetical protein [Actinomycetota bacterium]
MAALATDRKASKKASLAAVIVLGAFVSQAATAPVQAVTPIPCDAAHLSPDGQIAIVSDNIYADDAGDAKEVSRLGRFVDRSLSLADPTFMGPIIPDVVLLQEVRADVVATVKAAFEEKTSCDFMIAANAAKSAFRWADPKTRTKQIGQDTAVLMNKNTMTYEQSGYVSNSYRAKFAVGPVVVKKHAWAWMQEIDGDPSDNHLPLEVLATSAHYPRGSKFKSKEIELTLKRKFSKRIALFL